MDSAEFQCRDRRVQRVLRYVAQDLTRRPTLIDASRIAGLEATYFSKRFRVVVGTTYAEWSRRLRMEYAKQLLGIEDLSITAIAASVGYHDVTTFERVFRRCEGTCPRDYRSRVYCRTDEDVDKHRRLQRKNRRDVQVATD